MRFKGAVLFFATTERTATAGVIDHFAQISSALER